VNRLCDKCSYQNECFEDTHCRFLTSEIVQSKEGRDPDSVTNFERIKTLNFNDMVEFLSIGLSLSPADVSGWLAQETE